MADTSEHQMTVPPGEGWQWAFSYLRQDILDIRTELRAMRAEILEVGRRVDRVQTVTITTIVAIGGVLAALIKL